MSTNTTSETFKFRTRLPAHFVVLWLLFGFAGSLLPRSSFSQPSVSSATIASPQAGIKQPASNSPSVGQGQVPITIDPMDQMLKTEEHTVTALGGMYSILIWIVSAIFVLISVLGFKSYKDFNEKLGQAHIDFNKIKSDSEAEIKKMRIDSETEINKIRSDSESEIKKNNEEIAKSAAQRIAAQKEHDERIASLEKAERLQDKRVISLCEEMNDKIILATELSDRVETVEREMAKILALPVADQAQAVQAASERLLSKLEEARGFAARLGHRRLQSWIEAQEGRLHLLRRAWESAKPLLHKAEQLDAVRNPDRSFNLACLYGAWFEADVNSAARHDIDAMRWANETVDRAINTPHPARGRGHWFNLLETDSDLNAVRKSFRGDFDAMRTRLMSN